MVQSDKYANIPIISGCMSPTLSGFISRADHLLPANLDEGTWFVAATDIISFLSIECPGFAMGLSPNCTSPLRSLYPNDPALGSPYGTGRETFGRGRNYKQAASIVGDLLFTVSRMA